MKRSTKFFFVAAVFNIGLSLAVVLSTNLRDVRFVDLVLFFATSFGAGASCAAALMSILKSKESGETGSAGNV